MSHDEKSEVSRTAEAPLALVLGGSRGLGLLIGRELLERGHRIVITARDTVELERAREQLDGWGPVLVRTCDVRDRHGIRQLVDELEEQVGPIEVLVTVAGVIQVAPLESLTVEHFDEAIETMLWGPVQAAMTVLPAMRRRGRGRIATITSIGGMVSPPHLLPYATAKFGAVGFSDGLAAALSGSGVTATTVVPGLMRTGSQDRAQFGGDAPKEYAWFAPAASLPLLSVDAERAARRIVEAVLRGKPMVVLTPMAWVGIRVRGLAPATTTRLMGLANRLLPSGPDHGGQHLVEGGRAGERLASRTVHALTVLGRRAAERTNEHVRPDRHEHPEG
ncbi:short-chain dehydrogenase [Humibacillus sp. DSM 29435]|uniref:SDR family NAD(P)-dependent oxidoreductase n=1 Tax=Humibacillus sp. DSM 29435 TaxID=1869167 RepID=UPI000872E3E5|nr:SDR family NAD(P)-dependent oxidoreductase [Humibacillus sp. DSM 29435]OFE15052.1 short-chain dehydrogenase [Humibacillus sp. DSM 29435]